MKDPRNLPDSYIHQFYEQLDQGQELLDRYSVDVMYSLKREGDTCHVKLFYGKRTGINSIDVRHMDDLTIEGFKELDQKNFLKQLKEGIESLMVPEEF